MTALYPESLVAEWLARFSVSTGGIHLSPLRGKAFSKETDFHSQVDPA